MSAIKTPKKILVALSGGVDSSVCAALLKDAGHEVVGATCIFSKEFMVPGDEDLASAKEVAQALGIPHRTVDATKRFQEEVVSSFASGYAKGATPNPCIVCNPTTKFRTLFELAHEQGCDYVATGHYVERGEDGLLRRGVDEVKDQSYFLYRLSQNQLDRLIFPLAGLTKSEVRAIAEEKQLAVAEAPESQDACFISSDEGYLPIVEAQHPEAFRPGDILDAHGVVLGKHDGIARYTIGQRKGLGIAAPNPLYVTEIDPVSNCITVGELGDLARKSIVATDVIVHAPFTDGEEMWIKIRHGMSPAKAHVTRNANTLVCVLDEPINGVAPGQSLVCYRDDRVICGGIIA